MAYGGIRSLRSNKWIISCLLHVDVLTSIMVTLCLTQHDINIPAVLWFSFFLSFSVLQVNLSLSTNELIEKGKNIIKTIKSRGSLGRPLWSVYTVNFAMWDSSKWEISEGNLTVIMKNETWHTLLIPHKVYLVLVSLTSAPLVHLTQW